MLTRHLFRDIHVHDNITTPRSNYYKGLCTLMTISHDLYRIVFLYFGTSIVLLLWYVTLQELFKRGQQVSCIN